MCDHCKKLIECPVGEKRKSLIDEGVTYTGSKVSIETVLDRDPREGLQAFIHMDITEPTTEGNLWSNYSFDINYCPFCGENLRGEKDK